MNDQVQGWNNYYQRARLAHMPELPVVRFFRALRNRGGFLAEHGLEGISFSREPRVLDFGCGNGRHLVFLHNDGWNVTGCDVSSTAIALAKNILGETGKQLRLDVLAGSLPYDDNSFDIVLAHGVFDHIPSIENEWWQREVRRVLGPGGIFYASFIGSSVFGSSNKLAEEVLKDGEEAGLTQTFYNETEIMRQYGAQFRIRTIAYDNRGLVYPTNVAVEHRYWVFFESLVSNMRSVDAIGH